MIAIAIATPNKKRAAEVMSHILATVSSALPTDASALEASISALKSSISALESSLKTLEGSSGCWETLAWSCGLAVGIGIVGEIVVIPGAKTPVLTIFVGIKPTFPSEFAKPELSPTKKTTQK